MFAAVDVAAQTSPGWLQNETYWGDGKAEFNTYDAQEIRYGQPRASEVVHIFVREPFSRDELVKAEPGSKASTYPVLKLNQILHVPTGIYVYQQMHSAFWRVSDGVLIKATLTSNDGCGNTYKELRALTGWRAWTGAGWEYEWRTYWEGMSSGTTTVRAPKMAFFYDELPMRVRTLDFSRRNGELACSVAPSMINSKKDSVAFADARIRWSGDAPGEFVSVTVERAGVPKPDTFILEHKPPHRLREWRKSDGGSLRLRQTLKIDYWNYNKPGDRERALQQLDLRSSAGPSEAPSANGRP